MPCLHGSATTLFCDSAALVCLSCSALYFWYQIKHPESPVPPSVTELLHRLSQYETTIMEGVNTALQNPPPNISSVSENMEELDLKRSESGCCGRGSNNTECCKGTEKVDSNVRKLQKNLFSGASESLNCLLQQCIDLVSDLGLPQELSRHMEELKTTCR